MPSAGEPVSVPFDQSHNRIARTPMMRPVSRDFFFRKNNKVWIFHMLRVTRHGCSSCNRHLDAIAVRFVGFFSKGGRLSGSTGWRRKGCEHLSQSDRLGSPYVHEWSVSPVLALLVRFAKG